MTEEQKTQHDTPEAVVDTREAVEAIASTLEAEAQHFDRQSIIDAANNFAAMLRRLHQRAVEAERERAHQHGRADRNAREHAAQQARAEKAEAALATARAEGLREAAALADGEWCCECPNMLDIGEVCCGSPLRVCDTALPSRILALIEKEPK